MAASQARRQQWRFSLGHAESIKNLEAGKGRLPAGIEVQVLDLGYETNWKRTVANPLIGLPAMAMCFPLVARV